MVSPVTDNAFEDIPAASSPASVTSVVAISATVVVAAVPFGGMPIETERGDPFALAAEPRNQRAAVWSL